MNIVIKTSPHVLPDRFAWHRTDAGHDLRVDDTTIAEVRPVNAGLVLRVLVDMGAGVEHLGRGTVAHVDALLVVSEPSMRSLETAAEVARMAGDLGLHRQVLVLNKATPDQVADLPPIADLPQQRISMPDLEPLRARQLRSGSVLGLGDETEKMLDNFCASLLQKIESESVQRG